MSGKLDQSLDQILGDRKKNTPRRGRARRAAGGARVTKAAPAGGIQKNTKAQKNGVTSALTNGAKKASTETKIIVSNLPSDVSEQQIKEYFGDAVSPVARAMLTYGPNGVSRGIATVIFKKPGAANDAVTKLNGVQVDKRPMRIEVVLDAAALTQRASKALAERTNQPKAAAAAPKSAASDKKDSVRGGKTAGRGGRGRGRGGRVGRPKAKTAEELDAEMADYFDPNAPVANAENAPATNGATTNGDDAMDEIS